MRLSDPAAHPTADAGRKRAAVELIARHGGALRQIARRFSLCPEDAEDAYQRTLEILLTKAPSDRARELFNWSKTVIKHEALAIRRNRERLLGTPPPLGREREYGDWLALIPAAGDGPDERLERSEEIARSREALRALRPAELRALTLLAEGYSYAEIGEITGFSQTKVNRCLAEGRERFRALVSSSEDGSRCTELGPLLSRFCDAQTSAEETARVREHLRACGGCRATLRAYRSAPATVAALAPALPLSHSLLERAHEIFLRVHSRIPGAGGAADASMTQVAATGGAKGAGIPALAKLLAVCAATVGGATACVTTGVVQAPIDLAPDRATAPRIERVAERLLEEPPPVAVDYEPPPAVPAQPERGQPPDREPGEAEPTTNAATSGAAEYTEPATTPPPSPPPPATPAGTETPSGSAAGEFGP